MRLSALLLAVPLLMATGCRPNPPVDPPPEPPDVTVVSLEDECTNPTAGYTVAFSGNWQTNTGDVMPPCSLFDPEDVRVQPATEIPTDIAVAVSLERVPFETIAEAAHGEREASRTSTEISGRRAVRLEVEATGEAMYPEGARSTRYVVDWGEETLVAVTHDAGDLPYAQKQEILDRMMETLTPVE